VSEALLTVKGMFDSTERGGRGGILMEWREEKRWREF
jgi:hypothetical protein